ncbi:class I SAM-dependent methyltransferase [Aspergillus stella-maris]|uniref:class I SAM-dependent methyltransferase n=1 Tax=Aspergillus stella-maris TaxID=1810926 RepID=UPI003CCDB198
MSGNDRFNNEAASWDSNPSVQEATRLAFETLKPKIEELSRRKKALNLRSTGLDVLEVGCGTGLLTLRVAPLIDEIVALDPAQGMIDVLKGKIDNDTSTCQTEKGKTNITPLCTLLTNPEDSILPPSDPTNPDPTSPRKKYDLILSHLVLHHVPDLKSFLTTLLHCLRPGGRVALTDFEDFGPEAIKFHPPRKLEGVERHGIKRGWIEEVMREVGFGDVEVTVGWTLEKKVEEWEGHKEGDTMEFPFLVVEGGRA